MAHFRFQTHWKGFFGKLLHGRVRERGLREATGSTAKGRSRGERPWSPDYSRSPGKARFTRRPLAPGIGARSRRSALKTRNFITPLYPRDSCGPGVAKIPVFFAPLGGVCYISLGKNGFNTSGRIAASPPGHA